MVNSSNPAALQEKVKEAFADEAFVRTLLDMETLGEVRDALEEKGIELSEDEIAGIRDTMVKMEEQGMSADELSEEDLEEVAGGIFVDTVAVIIAAAVIAGGGTGFMVWKHRW